MRLKEAHAWSDKIASKLVVARNVIHRNAGATISWQTNECHELTPIAAAETCETPFADFAEFVYY